MTELLRLHGDERWQEWGDDWWDHADRVGELVTNAGAWTATARLSKANYPSTRLDWGALMFEMSKADLVLEFGARREVRPSNRAWRAGERWSLTVADLDDDSLYGLVVVEVY